MDAKKQDIGLTASSSQRRTLLKTGAAVAAWPD